MTEKSLRLPTASSQWDNVKTHLQEAKQFCENIDDPSHKKAKLRKVLAPCGDFYKSNLDKIFDKLLLAHNIIHHHAPAVQHNPFIHLKTFLSRSQSKETLAGHFLQHTLPIIIDLALSLNISELPWNLINEKNQRHHLFSPDIQVYELKLGQRTVASLLACMFLCIIPRTPINVIEEYNETDFCEFFPMLHYRAQESKLRMILRYFDEVLEKTVHDQYITYRLLIMKSPDIDSWLSCNTKLCQFEVNHTGKIEDDPEHLQVDFANEYIGGGVLVAGRAQEEIRFCTNPELLVSMLFMRRMRYNECIQISGYQTFSNYFGYADSLEDAGPYTGACEYKDGSLMTYLTAIDARCYVQWTRSLSNIQYDLENVLRDINKAFIGFQQPGSPVFSNFEQTKKEVTAQSIENEAEKRELRTISTGNWGSGAFGGDPHMKSLIQWIAASRAGSPKLIYYTFKDPRVSGNQLTSICSLLKDKTVRELVEIIIQYKQHKETYATLFGFIQETITPTTQN